MKRIDDRVGYELVHILQLAHITYGLCTIADGIIIQLPWTDRLKRSKVTIQPHSIYLNYFFACTQCLADITLGDTNSSLMAA